VFDGIEGFEDIENVSERARRALALATEETRRLNHSYIGTEQVLLGLIHEGEDVAAKIIESLGISLSALRDRVEDIIGRGQGTPDGDIPFTPRANRVLRLSAREAVDSGLDYVGTEHILLGLISEGEGVAAQVLVRFGADVGRIRQLVRRSAAGFQPPKPPAARDDREPG
jgi:ATP-dependent Clp protease ATP-binding subunit ClpC